MEQEEQPIIPKPKPVNLVELALRELGTTPYTKENQIIYIERRIRKAIEHWLPIHIIRIKADLTLLANPAQETLPFLQSQLEQAGQTLKEFDNWRTLRTQSLEQLVIHLISYSHFILDHNKEWLMQETALGANEYVEGWKEFLDCTLPEVRRYEEACGLSAYIDWLKQEIESKQNPKAASIPLLPEVNLKRLEYAYPVKVAMDELEVPKPFTIDNLIADVERRMQEEESLYGIIDASILKEEIKAELRQQINPSEEALPYLKGIYSRYFDFLKANNPSWIEATKLSRQQASKEIAEWGFPIPEKLTSPLTFPVITDQVELRQAWLTFRQATNQDVVYYSHAYAWLDFLEWLKTEMTKQTTPQPISQPQEPTATAASEQQNGKADQPPTSAVFIVPEARAGLYEEITPYVDEAERSVLRGLLEGATLEKPITIHCQQNEFAKVFHLYLKAYQITRKGKLFAHWLCSNFQRNDGGKIVPLTPSTMEAHM
ncbi:hypothetical protein GCM10023189_59030 [Nibrella saemangeumensis]|uniref:Uncharacterized protein n=1 Tax=Nibrella saemangeumensis TaxID=1084526 RepID=A0ABP8NPC3_9BACT